MDNADNTFTLIAKTSAGLEQVLADELTSLGATDISLMTRAVSFTADKRLMYKANYCVRTALRILKPLASFKARDEDVLYDQVRQIDWSQLMDTDKTLAIDAVVSGKHFTHSQYIALKTKDAIVDQFRDKTGSRPSVNLTNPDLRINLHIYNDQCSLLLDSSGESLHKRGYRVVVDKAPINEVLAAGLVLLSGWKADSHFVDCMCGSGTIPIEAAMIAMNIPGGYYREWYGFQRWNDFDEELWKEVVSEASDQIRDFDFDIIASDRSAKAIDIARENVRKARLHKDIQLFRKPMEQLVPPEGGGIMIINPPYGERLEEENLNALYTIIGNTLKHYFKGYKAWVISSDMTALKLIGLKPSKKIPVFNGPLDCRFLCFDIFDGSMKEKKTREAGEKG
ncbi:MAG: THUMP domain-containing protein [Bacteroidales bacterium]|nr:THUMP domain-containing protein [Bacteroidales bacterium]